MKIPFFQKRVASSTLNKDNAQKYSSFANSNHSSSWTQPLHQQVPNVPAAAPGWNTNIDPYRAADVRKERKVRARHDEESRHYYAQQEKSNLKRQKARYGDSRWTHMKRCNVYDHDNICVDKPGWHPCQGSSQLGGRCPGHFEVTERDAARAKNMRPEDRVPYSSLSDRYDYEARRANNMARTRAMMKAPPPPPPSTFHGLLHRFV